MIKHKILYRYIIFELLIPFLFSLMVLTFVLLLTKILNIAELLFEKDVGLSNFVNIVGSIALYLTGVSLPLSFLIGMMICFSRLAFDNEIIALRTSGISILSIFKPVLFLAMLLFGLAFILQIEILPRANWRAFKGLNLLAKDVGALLEEQVWMGGFGESSVFVGKINEDQSLEHIEINQPVKDSHLPRIVHAEKGIYKYDEVNRVVEFNLFNGYLDEPSKEKENSFLRIDYGQYSMALPVTKGEFQALDKKSYHMTQNELRKEMAIRQKNTKEYKNLLYEEHNRYSLAFANIVFLFIGFPLSLSLQRVEKSTHYVIGMGVAFIWYMFMICGRAMALGGFSPVVLGSWMPNLVIGGIGFYLTLRLLRT